VLLERESELAAVAALITSGGALVVEGGAGIGKTALLDAACTKASERGWRVLRGCGHQLETGFAFGVVRQLFERELAAADRRARAELLAGAAGAAGELLAPGQPEPGGDRGAGDVSFGIVHGLYWLTANMAEQRPVLIAVDDAHWADGASLPWLTYLATRLDGLQAGVLLALRPAEPLSDQVIVLCTVAAERNGQAWSSPEVHIWRVAGDRAVTFREFQGDQQTEDEFWSSAVRVRRQWRPVRR
jgi:hypothetical protein